MLWLSAVPVHSLEHSLKVWEVCVNFSGQPGDASLHLPTINELPLLPGWDEEGHCICLLLRAEPLLQQRPQASWDKQKSKWGVVCHMVAQWVRPRGRAESCRFQLLHSPTPYTFYSKQPMAAFCNCSRLAELPSSGSFTASKPSGFGFQCC